MINYPKELQRAIASGDADIKELSDFLIDNYSVREISMALAELTIMTENTLNTPPITISEEEFNRLIRLFKVRGIKGDGSKETRGRKPVK